MFHEVSQSQRTNIMWFGIQKIPGTLNPTENAFLVQEGVEG